MEYKYCGFCGSKDIVVFRNSLSDRMSKCAVRCDSCKKDFEFNLVDDGKATLFSGVAEEGEVGYVDKDGIPVNAEAILVERNNLKHKEGLRSRGHDTISEMKQEDEVRKMVVDKDVAKERVAKQKALIG